tara:strand:- start:715 stop:3381 length:2667 start_codon:yes stop_codon:yes gene_type:complete
MDAESFEALPKGFKLGTSVMPVQYRLDKKRELGYSDKLLDAREARTMKMTDKQQLEVADSLSEGDMIQIIVWLSLGGGVYELQSRKVAKIETKKLHKKFSFLETDVRKGWAEKVIILDMGERIIVSSKFPYIFYYEPPFPSLGKTVNKRGSLVSIEKIDGMNAETFEAEQTSYDVMKGKRETYPEFANYIHISIPTYGEAEAVAKHYRKKLKQDEAIFIVEETFDDETFEGDTTLLRIIDSPKEAETFEAKSYQVGDEGMFEGGEIRIISIEDNEGEGRQNVYIFTYLDDEGNPDGFVHTSDERKFMNQFAMFPREMDAETFEAPSCNCERFDRSDWDSNRCATCGEMRKGYYGAETFEADYDEDAYNAEELPIEVSFTKKNIKFVSYTPPKTWTHGNPRIYLGIWFGEEDDYERWKVNVFVLLKEQELLYMLKESSDRTFKVRKAKRGNYYYFDNKTFEADGDDTYFLFYYKDSPEQNRRNQVDEEYWDDWNMLEDYIDDGASKEEALEQFQGLVNLWGKSYPYSIIEAELVEIDGNTGEEKTITSWKANGETFEAEDRKASFIGIEEFNGTMSALFYLPNHEKYGSVIPIPLSEIKELDTSYLASKTMSAEELGEKVKNLIKIGDIKVKEYLDGRLERFDAESLKPMKYTKRVNIGRNNEPKEITIFVDEKLAKILEAKNRGNRIRYDYANPIEETSSNWVYVLHDSGMSQGTGFEIVDLNRGISSQSMGMFYDGTGNYEGDVVNFKEVKDGGKYRYEDLVRGRVRFSGEDHDHDHDHDHEDIDELIHKLNTVVDFAITFVHDGGYGGEPKGILTDKELGIKTEVVNYVEGSIQLRLVRDIETDELLSVRFSLTGDPEDTPIVYLPLPEEITTVPDDERSKKAKGA